MTPLKRDDPGIQFYSKYEGKYNSLDYSLNMYSRLSM